MRRIWKITTESGVEYHEFDAPLNIEVRNTVSGEISREEIAVDEYVSFLDKQLAESQNKEK